MCGIAGLVSQHRRDMTAIVAMTEAQAHRGPDGQGFCIADGLQASFGRSRAEMAGRSHGQVAFGHRRLAIIDVTDAGHQPMASDDGRLWITYNGEVYNYIELREELSREGVAFSGGSDTEVVLAAYRRWGVDCFARFNGMWALAIWDRDADRVVLARDRLGVKPLHVARDGDTLMFSSEIKGLLAAGLRPRLDRAAAADFLRHGVVNHGDATFFEGVAAFPPGHYAVVPLDRAPALDPKPFWSLPLDGEEAVGEAEAVERFRELFLSAVRLRMRSDVTVGACLSGGLDSSSIVCAAAREASAPLVTFTSAFKGGRYDERRYAELAIRRAGADPRFVFPEADGFVGALPSLIRTQEEPFTTTSIYAQNLLMRAAREAGVIVLLDGQGADEILCGYRKYMLFYAQELRRRGDWGGLLRHGAQLLAHGDRGVFRLAEGVRYLPQGLRSRAEGLSASVRPGFAEWGASRLAAEPGAGLAPRQADDLRRYSVPSLLRYEDRNSMAWGIESRVPFLDYRLVELLMRLPGHLKVSGGRTKALLRTAMRGLVPDEILDRRDKMGFETPQQEWLSGPLRASLERTLGGDAALSPLVDTRRALALADAGGYWQRANRNALFRLFVLESWAQVFDVAV
ncbi:MAG TPA: asparagine synthase (glutamine-hydrolyzing) [Alphaproteobacteria bacterium]|nr:asparagine synthase (glutamine-hydrolyzing) [Alphaproteobacteria bacterium]